jgi:hypothetical protein
MPPGCGPLPWCATRTTDGPIRETDAPLLSDSFRRAREGHAIDALYGEIKSLVDMRAAVLAAWNANDTARPDRIFETLKRGCRLGPKTNAWPRRFKALYTLRDPVVHHELRQNPAIPHPNGLAHVSQAMADYCVENARESRDFAIDVILTALRSPRTPALVRWAAGMPHMPGVVEVLRDGP